MKPAVEIQSSRVGKVAILDISGDIASPREREIFSREFRYYLIPGRGASCSTPRTLTTWDSTEIDEIVRFHTTVTNGGGQLKLLNVSETLNKVLSITKLLMIFDTFKDEGEALVSF